MLVLLLALAGGQGIPDSGGGGWGGSSGGGGWGGSSDRRRSGGGGHAWVQMRGSKFQSLNSNSRELELTNLLGLVQHWGTSGTN